MWRLFVVSSALLQGAAEAWHCPVNGSPEWPDHCDGVEDSRPCKPYAPLGHAGTPADWLAAREALQHSVFGGSPPTRTEPDSGPTLFETPVTFGNCLCLLRGECEVQDCSRSINVSTFDWVISQPVNATFNLTLTSTVFHSLNSSGLAVDSIPSINYSKSPAQYSASWPEVPQWPQRLSDTLVIFHDGHMVVTGCHYDDDGTVDWLNQLGYDVMHIQMPLHGCNMAPGEDPTHPISHSWFAQFAGPDGSESDSFPFMRYFLEPVWLTINYAKKLGYKNIVMAGLSGGGWTTTLMSAIDPRIGLSIPVAGSMPCDFAHTSWDYEQFCDQPWAHIANYTSLYVMAALEKSRAQIQVIHEWDNCCFHACGRHQRIAEYNDYVRANVEGQFITAATHGNIHEVNPRDKVIISSMTERWLQNNGNLSDADMASIPFSITPLHL